MNQPRNVIAYLRDIEARNAALRMYAAAHDRFAEDEQVHRMANELPEANGAHQYAVWALRAWIVERDDPEPRS